MLPFYVLCVRVFPSMFTSHVLFYMLLWFSTYLFSIYLFIVHFSTLRICDATSRTPAALHACTRHEAPPVQPMQQPGVDGGRLTRHAIRAGVGIWYSPPPPPPGACSWPGRGPAATRAAPESAPAAGCQFSPPTLWVGFPHGSSARFSSVAAFLPCQAQPTPAETGSFLWCVMETQTTRTLAHHSGRITWRGKVEKDTSVTLHPPFFITSSYRHWN